MTSYRNWEKKILNKTWGDLEAMEKEELDALEKKISSQDFYWRRDEKKEDDLWRACVAIGMEINKILTISQLDGFISKGNFIHRMISQCRAFVKLIDEYNEGADDKLHDKK